MAFWDLKVRRSRPVQVQATGLCRCGAAETDITPPLHRAMAGHSLLGQRGHGFRGRLFVRTLYLEDFDGRAVALCVADMYSGTRYLLEKAAAIAGPQCGISVDRLLLAGTHTHLAPGNVYGASLYDALAQSEIGFARAYADWLAERIASSVVEAQRFAVEANVGVHRLPVWDVASNRSVEAFVENPEAARWHDDGWPGEGRLAPDALTPQERARLSVDPRLTAIAAVSVASERPLAVMGVFGCRANAFGDEIEAYAPDWNGWAIREASRRLNESFGTVPILGLAQGASGDVDPDVDWTRGSTFAEARAVGQRIGAGWALAAEEAIGQAAPFELEVAFDDGSVTDSQVDGEARVDAGWAIGVPRRSALGSNRDGWMKLLAREGGTTAPVAPVAAQSPKVPAVRLIRNVMRHGGSLHAPPTLPVHLLKIRGGERDHWFATVCGEPTVVAAHRIERALRGEPPTREVTVIGLAGDYSGYFTTPEEYELQRYEGAQTLHGRGSAELVRERLVRLSSNGAQHTDHDRDIAFPSYDRGHDFSARSNGGRAEARNVVARRHPADPRHVIVSWTLPGRTDPSFHEGPFVTVFRRVSDRWDLLEHFGRPFDDRYQDIWVSRAGPGLLDRVRRRPWRVELWLPAAMSLTERILVRVHPRGGFPGFEVEV